MKWAFFGPLHRLSRLTNTLVHGGPTESTVLLEEPETLDAELLQQEEAEAKSEAERTRPGLTMFADGSRLDDGATEYSVVLKRGLTWAGAKVHLGNNQEAYDAECAALAHALELATQRSTIPERVTIFSDAQAAIRRMASDEPGPGQQYALQARKHITTLRRARKGIVIEIRWCPAHKGVAGNEKADEWAKIAAGQPNTHGVEWLSSRAGRECGWNLSHDPSPALSGKSQRRSGRRHVSGPEVGPRRRSTACRRARNPMARWPTTPRGSPRGGTS